MHLDHLLAMLEEKDTSAAFEALKALEEISEASDALYPYTDRLAAMIGSDKYVLRVRGFRLFCKQAKWDRDNRIDRHLERALGILGDEKPTAVRQALAALLDLVPYKSALSAPIRERVLAIDPYRYKDTMHGLIEKDRNNLLRAMAEAQGGNL